MTSLLRHGQFLLLVSWGYNVPELNVCRDMPRLQTKSGDVSAIVLQHTTEYVLARLCQSHLVNASTLNCLRKARDAYATEAALSTSQHMCMPAGADLGIQEELGIDFVNVRQRFCSICRCLCCSVLADLLQAQLCSPHGLQLVTHLVTYCAVTPVTTLCTLRLLDWRVFLTFVGQWRPHVWDAAVSVICCNGDIQSLEAAQALAKPSS